MKKKLMIVVLAAVMLFGAIAVSAADSAEDVIVLTPDENGEYTLDLELWLYGDGELDGDVDMTDAVAFMRHALKADIITNPDALSTGEVTGDGSISMEDAVKIMRYALKAIDSLE